MAAEDLQPDSAQAVEFITKWSAPPWTAIAIEPTIELGQNAKCEAKSFDTIKPLLAFIEHWNGKYNLYFTVNRCLPDVRTSPTKGQTTHMRALHFDLDPEKSDRDPKDQIDELLAKVELLDPPCPILVFSGGGLQGFYPFPDELPANEYLLRVEAVNQTIIKNLGADPACFNANRLMRLPGTINMLNARKVARGRKPQKTFIVRADWDVKWSFDSDVVPRIPTAETIEPADDVAGDGESKTFAVNDLPAKLKRAIKVGDATAYNNDRSRLVWYVTCSLVRLGWADESICAVLLDSNHGCSGHSLDQSNPERYAREQVRKAKDAVAEDWKRDAKGTILSAHQMNIRKAFTQMGVKFYLNVFEDRAYVNGVGPTRVLDDGELAQLRLEVDMQYDFLPPKELFGDVVTVMARQQRFNPVRQYLDRNQQLWDRKPRIGGKLNVDDSPGWLTIYAEAEDSPYMRAVSRLTLIAGVRRIRQPGVKHDEMLIFVTPEQGTDKSTALAILAKKPEWFSDSFTLQAKDKEVIEKLQGKWIIECSELSGMKQAQIEEVKAQLSRQYDHARMAYGRLPVQVPRQCVFFGTTNSTHFLRDIENRRFWPARIKHFDIERLRADVDQLWAEAAFYEAQGESIQLPRELWGEATKAQDEYRVEEPWASVLGDALGNLDGRIMSDEIWKILGKPIHQRQAPDNARLGDVMRELGWSRKQLRFAGFPNPKWCYSRGNGKAPLHVTVDSENGQTIVVASTYAPGVEFETPNLPSAPPF